MRAGLVTRFAASTIDAAVVVGLLAGGYLLLVAGRFLLSPQTFRFPAPSLGWLLIGFLALAIIYLTVTWATAGRSYGDHVMGLRVLGARGQTRVGWASALLRATFAVLVPIGLLWVTVSRANRSLQDVVLRTSVVYDWTVAGVEEPHR